MNYITKNWLVDAIVVLVAGFCSVVPAAAGSGAEELRLTVGKSVVIDYPMDVRQISTSNPEIVDASPVTTRELLVHGKGLGTATLIVWSKGGDRTFYNIAVEANLDPLRKLLKDTFPAEEIRVQSSRDSLSLTGRVSSKQVSDRAAALATPFAKTIVDNLVVSVAPIERQILLRVKFAQLDRIKAAQYGVNLVSTGATNSFGSVSVGQFNSTSVGGSLRSSTSRPDFSITDALNIFAFRPDLNLGAFLKALQGESILEILAEPNLVATNGKEASFLVGGEFPVPVLQGGGNAGSVTIMFREFGIRLYFTPIVTENKTIKIHLRQEVSTTDYANAVVVSGFTIPALATRRAETDIELAENQTFVVAGLLDNRETEQISKIPGLASLPILGALFKNRDVKQQRSELVLVVTPEFTHPLAAGEKAELPDFPREFLIPLKPTTPKTSAPPARTDAPVKKSAAATQAAPAKKSAAPQTASRKHWYSIRKSN